MLAVSEHDRRQVTPRPMRRRPVSNPGRKNSNRNLVFVVVSSPIKQNCRFIDLDEGAITPLILFPGVERRVVISRNIDISVPGKQKCSPGIWMILLSSPFVSSRSFHPGIPAFSRVAIDCEITFSIAQQLGFERAGNTVVPSFAWVVASGCTSFRTWLNAG